MEVLNRAYKTSDGKIFSSRDEALKQEERFVEKKALESLVRNWFGYEVTDYEVNFVVENLLHSKAELLRIIG